MEFGSDFHRIEYPIGNGLPYGIFNHYVSGRQPLLDIIQNYGYRRIWIPSYYCGESITILDRSNVVVKRYNCLPTDNPDKVIENLQLESYDLLMRVNFFGLHKHHNSNKYPCDVIEDHTHDLLGDWACNSNARWCFASLRKTLPTADGGILWSPNNQPLPEQHIITNEVADTITFRYNAMGKKSDYLNGQHVLKESFLNDLKKTEERFETFALSDCSSTTHNIINSINIESWYNIKKANYLKLLSLLDFNFSYPIIGNLDKSTPFSLILLFNNNILRENARKKLIQNNVYPAILWPDVYYKDTDAIDFSNRMLSIHCDGRYTVEDMHILAQRLNKAV